MSVFYHQNGRVRCAPEIADGVVVVRSISNPDKLAHRPARRGEK